MQRLSRMFQSRGRQSYRNLGFGIWDLNRDFRGKLVMGAYKRFEEHPVWNGAVELAAFILDWTTQAEFRGRGDLANPMQRATLSRFEIDCVSASE